MKKIFVLLLIITVSVSVFAASEEVEVYAYLYNNAITHSGQLVILQNMDQARLAGAGEFYASALRQLISGYKNIKDTTERSAAEDQAKILSKLLGAEKYSQASADLWLVAEGFTDPLVRAEALIAIGKIRSATYLPHVIRLLSNYNEKPTQDPMEGGRIAFGAIISLEKYQDPSGYIPVFIASTAWYPNRIKEQAKKSMPLIAKDPTPYMTEVVKGAAYNYERKKIALENIDSTNVSREDKASVAVVALGEGWKSSTNVQRDRILISEMRKYAIDMINKYRTNDDSVYPLLDRSMKNGNDASEKIKAIGALASQKSDEGTEVLSSYLRSLNNRQQSGGLTRDELNIVKAIIPALGHTENSKAREPLNQVTVINYTKEVKKLADNALKQIPN